MGKAVILTGLRANEDLHIGNFFGALLPIVDIAKQHSNDYQVNLFVPDLHSFTTPVDHSKLYDQTIHNLKLFVAAGLPLDQPNIYIYRQSFIPAHSELTWILDCFTGFGEMNRMTQFKDKASNLGEDRISVGVFNYPVLMAADILLYDAKYIPVGDDQSQHIEFARDIAERINNRFGQLFLIPEAVEKQHQFFGKDQGLRIKDLVDPTKKMSKSNESKKGVIFLSDPIEESAKKIINATTDSISKIKFDTVNQPGISNLLQILALLSVRQQSDVNKDWEGKSSYGELKQAVAQVLKDFLTDFQQRLSQVNESQIIAKLAESETAMNNVANNTLLKVQQALGLRSKT